MKIIETREDMLEYEKAIWRDFWAKKGLESDFKQIKYKFIEGDTPIGYMSVLVDAGVLYIKDIILEEKFRGGKRGHKIMEFIESLAEKHNCHKMRLETSSIEMPNAYYLYQKFGFKDETILKDDWFHKDWVVMSKFRK